MFSRGVKFSMNVKCTKDISSTGSEASPGWSRKACANAGELHLAECLGRMSMGRGEAFRNPKAKHRLEFGCIKPCKEWEKLPYQLVIAGFLNHQRYEYQHISYILDLPPQPGSTWNRGK